METARLAHTLSTLPMTLVLVVASVAGYSSATSDSQCPRSPAQSYLWRVRSFPPAYVFGTVHVANDAIWPRIPANVKTAWTESDAVFAELDWSDGQTQEEVRRCRRLPEGQTIENLLPPDVFDRLKLFMKKVRNALPTWVKSSDLLSSFLINWKMQKKQLFQQYVGDWRRKRPIWALLLVNDLSREKIENSGNTVLDENLLNVARERGQVTGALETATEQCGPLNRLNESVVIQALNHTLAMRLQEDWKSGAANPGLADGVMTETEALVTAYNCGHFNNRKFVRKLTGKKKKKKGQMGGVLGEFDSLVEASLVVGRNRQLAHTVSRLLRLHKTESLFFAMGVAHLVGNDSVLSHLKSKGHLVQSIARQEALTSKPMTNSVGVNHQPSVQEQGAGGKPAPGDGSVWKAAFSAVPNAWMSIATGGRNDNVKPSPRRPPSGLVNATAGGPTMKRVEQQTAATDRPVEEAKWKLKYSASVDLQVQLALLLWCLMSAFLLL